MFNVDNHSIDEISFLEVQNEEKNWLVERIAELYPQIDYQSVKSVNKISGENKNSGNYKINNFYLKVIKDKDNRKSYVNDFPQIIDRLCEVKIKTPQILKNKFGEKISRYKDTSDITFYFILQEFVTGNFFSGKEEELQSYLNLLTNLKEFNLKTINLKAPYFPYRNFDIKDKYIKLRDLLSRDSSPIFQKCSIELSDFMDKNLKSLCEESEYLKNYDSNVFHYDLHPHNLLFRKNNIESILDLESFVVIPYELMTGFGIFKLSRKSISSKQMTLEEVHKALSGSNFNLSSLQKFAYIEVLRRILTILELKYFSNDETWVSDLEKQLNSLKEIKKIFEV